MTNLKKIIKILILSALLLVIGTSVFAKELDIINSSKLNKGLDLGTGSYFDTLIQDNIVNATCDWSGFGCAIQVPISPTQQMISNQNYKISILLSVPTGIKIVPPKFTKNLAFSKFENADNTVALWRLWNYSLPNNFVYNADIEISLQSSAHNIDIYSVDYSFKSNASLDFDVVALAFALNTSNSTQTGTIKFSYLMLDATNQEIVDAVKDLSANIDDVNKSINDTSVPSFDQNKFLGYLPENALSAILNLPLNVLNSIQSNLTSSTCNDLVLPLPYLDNESIKLECVSKLYQKMGFTNLINWLGTLLGAFMLYNYLINLYKWVDGVLTFRENNWEGYD